MSDVLVSWIANGHPLPVCSVGLSSVCLYFLLVKEIRLIRRGHALMTSF